MSGCAAGAAPAAICEWVSESNPPRPINPTGGLSRSPSGQAFTVSAKSSKNQPVANIFERVTRTVLARKDHAMKHSNSVLYSQPRCFSGVEKDAQQLSGVSER
jgi:hypothetical protein